MTRVVKVKKRRSKKIYEGTEVKRRLDEGQKEVKSTCSGDPTFIRLNGPGEVASLNL